MRNPDLAMTKLEKLEGKLTSMNVLITRPTTTKEQYQNIIKEAHDIISDLKMMVQRNG
jgi:hypothetical protein